MAFRVLKLTGYKRRGKLPGAAGTEYRTNLADIDTTTQAIGFSARDNGSCGDFSQFWTGILDDLRVYNRAFSAAEIQVMYNATR
jgi:Concanavalin A-like lectin/glucanases superfamily